MEIKEPRKIFTVLIHNKEYDVYSIDGKEHAGHNGEIKTWWLYYSDRLPEGLVPPVESEEWEPWHKWINRRLWDIRFKQTNTSKYKWDEHQFSNHTQVEMWCNNKLIYSFDTSGDDSGLAFAFGKVQYLKVMFAEHPFNFFEPEKEKGRKIWWYGLPATIALKSDPWEIKIIPDYTAGVSQEEWWKELRNRESKLLEKPDTSSNFQEVDEMYKEESREDGYINWGDAFEDAHIDWFRK